MSDASAFDEKPPRSPPKDSSDRRGGGDEMEQQPSPTTTKRKSGSSGYPPQHQQKAPLPFVSTPARDPATLVAKRMQHLRLHCDTNNSTIGSSTGSPAAVATDGSPMRCAPFPGTAGVGTPSRCDLTPVTRNTAGPMPLSSGEVLDFDLDFDLDMLDARSANVVSPDCNNLAIPENLSHQRNNSFSARPVHPNLPPLASRGLLQKNNKKAEWTRRTTSSTSSSGEEQEPPPPTAISLPRDVAPAVRAPELAFLPPVEDPIPFPPSGKGYSFTCMQQYEKKRMLAEHHMSDGTTTTNETQGLTPYQPSRRDPGLEMDIPTEELSRIFITRPTFSSGATSSDTDDFMADNGNNAQLFTTIPLEDREFSIPSIRMANQLIGGSSVASYSTAYTDEEDESVLLYRDDDASLSSFESYSPFTPGDESNIQSAFGVSFPSPATQQQQGGSLEEESMQQSTTRLSREFGSSTMTTDDDDVADTHHGDDAFMLQPAEPAPTYHHHRRRQKRKEQRDRKAYEWLRTIKAGQDEVAEAASSKFLLTGNSNNQSNNQARPHHPLYDKPEKRLSMAAVETSSFAFLAKDCSSDHGCDDEDTQEEVARSNALGLAAS